MWIPDSAGNAKAGERQSRLVRLSVRHRRGRGTSFLATMVGAGELGEIKSALGSAWMGGLHASPVAGALLKGTPLAV